MRMTASWMVRVAVLSLLATSAPAWGTGTLTGSADINNFELVGHDPLFARGMNSAIAKFGDAVYVGSRTDGQPHHPHPGVLIVDVSDPAAPEVAGEILDSKQGQVGDTSRELRVWPEESLLFVMNFGCSALIHACAATTDVSGPRNNGVNVYDLADPFEPTLVATVRSLVTPHEMFLWVDPQTPGRALLYMSTPTSALGAVNLLVAELDPELLREGVDAARWWQWRKPLEFQGQPGDARLHSMGVSLDGSRTHLAFLGGGFLVLDTSDLAAGVPDGEARLVTPVADRVHWGNPGAHSAVKVPGRDLVLVTDEVYGDLLDPITGADHGCPWGWVRMVDVSDETKPEVVGEFRTSYNEASHCESAEGLDPSNTLFASFSSHNPTVTDELAFVTWHSAGLRVVSLADPTGPQEVGRFVPTPLPVVVTEDPALSAGRPKVVMWSYPVISDGLVYVTDVRNGLYILRYTGPGSEAVDAIEFLEGNSNLGDAVRLGN